MTQPQRKLQMDTKVILVVGGAGALGSALLQTVTQNGSKGICVDLRPSEFPNNIVIKPSDSVDVVMEAMKSELVDKVDAVYCVAGSWKGGYITSDDLIETSKKMWQVNVEPSILSAQLASRLNAKLCVLTSAKAVLHGTPDMLGYGMAKQAVVHLAKSLAADKSFPARTICIMPEVIDTKANRDCMPGADTSKWTKLEVLSEYLWKLSIDHADVPSGSLVTIVTRDNDTTFTVA